MKITDKSRIFYRYIIPIFVGIIFILLSGVWVCSQKNIFRKQTMTMLRNESNLIMESVRSIIQSQMRMGLIDRQRLNFILDNILERTSIDFLCIRNNSKIIYESDNTPSMIGGVSDGTAIDGKTFYCWKNFNLENIPPPIPKRKKKDFHMMMFDDKRDAETGNIYDFRNAIQQIVIGIDATPYINQIKAENKKLLIIFIFAFLGTIVIVLAWIHYLKSSAIRYELEKMKARNEKLEEMSLAAAGLAHEVKNPLGIIRGFAQKLSSLQTKDESLKQIAEKIIDEADLTTERLSDFMNYAKKRTLKLSAIDAQKEITQIIELLQFEFEEKKILFSDSIEPIKIIADKSSLQQILVNILMNSIQACASGSRIELELKKKQNSASIIIKDNGKGICPELLRDIFKPYVSGHNKGHGIGLAIVKKLVEEHGWNIQMSSDLHSGTITELTGIIVSV